ncbi:ABC transporter substrate-binding protein [Glaciibacter sp. 2TAF33]|uniref:ABC transporter substrate-binding protein n=1 Tax=Glaciibacter sp. 2TAF33 TaxID=3233015 RepID=UPI003F91430A
MSAIRLATRHWDHVMPIATKEVPGFESFDLETRAITPDVWTERDLDGGETSFSRYVRARATGDDSVTALPVFIMRGFRHRCIITAKNSPLETAADLRGKRIGLTGWADSGNTWTRAILRQAGVGIIDAEWRVGGLTKDHPIMDRIGPIEVPANIAPTENDEPMVDMLERGALDAVMTPFMPAGFYEADAPFRTLYRDPQQAEADYYATTGFIPGIHVLAVQTSLLAKAPERAAQLMELFESAKDISSARRGKLLDITPWQNEAMAEATRVFGSDWMPYGLESNRTMIAAFQAELIAQGLMDEDVDVDRLFPQFDTAPSAIGVSA